jgi:uncharacterized protein (TIGR03437 family)
LNEVQTMLSLLKASLLVCAFSAFCNSALAADAIYEVTLDTSSLVNHPAGPFYVYVALTDGSGVGNSNNTVTLSNFTFGGGSALGTPVVFGGGSGSLETGVTIRESSFLSFFAEQFTPGLQLSFSLDLTLNTGGSVTPDRFTFFLLDSSGVSVPTLAPTVHYFLGADIYSAGPVFDAYGSDPSVAPSVGNPVSISVSVSTGLPAPVIAGMVPVDSTVTTIQPGEWVSIYGSGLASTTAAWNENFPTSLDGTSVTINGKAAYLSFVSPGQINVQAPNDTAAGSVPVTVMTGSGTATSAVTLAQFAPSFFLLDSKHVAGIILRGGASYDILGPTGNSLGYPTVAAKAGDTVELYGTGFGPTRPAVQAGQVFSGAAPTINPVTLLLNNVSVTPSFAGLSGAGLYQINLTIPAGLGTGDVPLVATVGGVHTPSTIVISLQ